MHSMVTIVNNQFNAVTQSCSTLCDPMDCSMPDLPAHCQLLGLAETHLKLRRLEDNWRFQYVSLLNNMKS